jgi:hypothetical protein
MGVIPTDPFVFTFSSVTSNHSIDATFVPDTFTIIASASAGGTMTPSGNLTVNAGAAQAFTIAPLNGYRIVDVVVDGVSALGSPDLVTNPDGSRTFTFTSVSTNHTILATFVVSGSFLINASASTIGTSVPGAAGGSISPSGFIPLLPGASQGFFIAANPGYNYVDLIVDGVSQTPPLPSTYQFIGVAADHTITAVFQGIPAIGVSPASPFDFGNVNAGTITSQSFTINNTGTGDLLLGQAAVTGPDAAKFTLGMDTCSNQMVLAGGLCISEVAFNSTYLGLKTATLTVPSNDPVTPALNIELSATEILCPVIFADVPSGYLFENQIKAMYCNNITAGCSAVPLNFCPTDNTTRKEAAVFITKAMKQAPAPVCTGTVFADVNAATVGDGFCRYIEIFSTLGITAGCQADNLLTPENEAMFCPEGNMTRKEAAVFITKAMSQAPAPVCTGTVFADVNAATVGDGFCRYIEIFSTLGITAGCQADNPLTPENEAMFCPDDLVSREQIAAFLTNGFLK